MLGSVEILSIPVRLATIVVPVAIYFLILGLLNSRRHPQLLSGRMDFALLNIALCPLYVLPIFNYLSGSAVSLGLAAAAIGGLLCVLMPPARSWVIYNMPVDKVRTIVAESLNLAGLEYHEQGGSFVLPQGQARLQIDSFSLLRNVSFRLVGGDQELAGRIESHVSRRVAGMEAETSPMAMCLLLVATAMMVVPLTMVAGRAGEIVRLLGDLLK